MNADDLAKILDELGRRLGPTGEHVFQLAVRQVYIDSAIQIITAVVVLGVSLAIIRPLHEWSQGGGSYDDRSITLTFGGIVPVAAVVLLVGNAIFAALPRLLNPEYAALRDILGAIGR